MFSKTELILPTESDTHRITTCEILKRERIRCLFAGASGMVLCQLRVFMHYLPEMEFCHFSGSASCFAPSFFFSALQFFEGVVPFCSRGDIGTRPFLCFRQFPENQIGKVFQMLLPRIFKQVSYLSFKCCL